MRLWFGILILCFGLAREGLGAPGVANPGQQGSLLIFPRIDVRDGYTTLIRLGNMGAIHADITCFWVNADGQTRGFAFRLLPGQPASFDARTGDGTVHTGAFPSGNTGTGQLLCWALHIGGTRPARWNHLSGTAEVIRYEDPAAGEIQDPGAAFSYRYPAFAWYARGGGDTEEHPLARPVKGAPGRLDLDGLDYDACGEYLVGQFAPVGVSQPLGVERVATWSRHQLSWASCVQDFTEPGRAVLTPIAVEFEVFNASGIKMGSSVEVGGPWHEVSLDASGVDQYGDIFTIDQVGTPTATFRARALDGAGLVGVLVSEFYIDGAWPVVNATTLTLAGQGPGLIEWTPPELAPARVP